MTRFNLYLLLFAVLIVACKGQTKPNLSENKPSNALAEKGQLDIAAQISEYIVAIFEDSKGNLWFGTVSDGVVRFDGKKLSYLSTNDGLCDNTVTGITEDKTGNIWIGTHNGIAKYDGKKFTIFKETTGKISGCKILIDSKGQIWAGTTEGAYRFNGSSFSKFEIPKPVIDSPSYKVVTGKVWSIIEDKKGNIWFGIDGLGACKYDGTTFTHFTKKDGLCSNNVSQIVEDNQGNIWFASITSDFPKEIKEGGVSRYDGKNITQFSDIQGLTNNDIYSLYKDKRGHIWIAALHYGAYRYDGVQFTLFKDIDKSTDMIRNFPIQSILEDSRGKFWFGFSGGLFRFNGSYFVNITRNGISE